MYGDLLHLVSVHSRQQQHKFGTSPTTMRLNLKEKGEGHAGPPSLRCSRGKSSPHMVHSPRARAVSAAGGRMSEKGVVDERIIHTVTTAHQQMMSAATSLFQAGVTLRSDFGNMRSEVALSNAGGAGASATVAEIDWQQQARSLLQENALLKAELKFLTQENEALRKALERYSTSTVDADVGLESMADALIDQIIAWKNSKIAPQGSQSTGV